MRLSLIALIALLFSACSSTRIVKPLQKGQVAAGFDFGGPLIDFAGIKIPMPFTSLTGAYGFTDNLSAFASVHTTAAAAGVFQMELGAIHNILPHKEERRFNLSAAVVTHYMAREEFRFYPEIDLNAYWQYSPKRQHFAYASVANWFDIEKIAAHGTPNTERYIPNFSIGHTFVTPKMRYSLEARWLAPFSNNQNIVVNFNGLANQGSLGLYFSVYRCF